jgi:hypothetical protein
MSQDSSETELEWLGRILWGGMRSSPNSRYAVLPSPSRPRLLLPLETARPAAAVLRTYTTSTRRSRVGARLLGMALRIGVGKHVLRTRVGPDVGDDDPNWIETHLREILGRHLVASVFFQTGRPQKKPVLQLLTPSGTPVGFAKVGWNELTRTLVDAEAEALIDVAATLDSSATVSIPRVLHHGIWQQHTLVVVSAMRGVNSEPLAQFPEAATRDLARLTASGTTTLGRSPYWLSQRGRIERLSSVSLQSVARVIENDRLGYRFGRIHGDWVPWNMSRLPGGEIAAWDWEWSRNDAPLGLDTVQWLFQDALNLRRLPPHEATDETIHRAAQLLPAIGVDGRCAQTLLGAHIVESTLRLREAQSARVAGVIPTDRYDRAAARLCGAQ